MACQQLSRLVISKQEEKLNEELKLDDKQAFYQELQKYATEYIKNLMKGKNNLNKDEQETLNQISKRNSLVISKADKGNAVVIQNKTDYIRKAIEIISDKSKFSCLESDPTLEREAKLQRQLNYLRKKGNLSDENYHKIRPVGSKAGVLYTLPKVHKNEIDPPP